MSNVLTIAYLAGPMNNQPEHGYPKFEKAKTTLEDSMTPYLVLSPRDGAPSVDAIRRAMIIEKVSDFNETRLYAEMMKRCIYLVLMSEIVFMLPGWEKSRGARFERELAIITGTPVVDGAFLLK